MINAIISKWMPAPQKKKSELQRFLENTHLDIVGDIENLALQHKKGSISAEDLKLKINLIVVSRYAKVMNQIADTIALEALVDNTAARIKNDADKSYAELSKILTVNTQSK